MNGVLVVLVVLVMFRLSMMRSPLFAAFHPSGVCVSPDLGSTERKIVFGALSCVVASGFVIQPLIQGVLAEPLPETASVSRNLFRYFTTGLVPGSIIAYLVISMRQEMRLVKGSILSVAVLTGFDFLALLQGAMPITDFPFSFICNLVGGPIGVCAVILLFGFFRQTVLSRHWQHSGSQGSSTGGAAERQDEQV